MRTISFATVLGVLCIAWWAGEATGQGLQVRKHPLEATTVSWTFATANEAAISGFVVQVSGALAGPWLELAATARDKREFSFPAPALPALYRVLSYKDDGTGARTLSDASNVVAVEIVLPPPLGSSIR